MILRSGWNHFYHSVLIHGVLECDWDQGRGLISLRVDTWSKEMRLGSEGKHLYHSESIPEVHV